MIYWASFSQKGMEEYLPCQMCQKGMEKAIFLYSKTETEKDFLYKRFKLETGISLCFDCKDKFEEECKKNRIGFKKLETDKERLDLLPDVRRNAHSTLTDLLDDEK